MRRQSPLPFNLRDQVTSEVFYRLAFTSWLAFTPDYQFIINPTLHPGKDTLHVFSLRARVAF
jgi:porin